MIEQHELARYFTVGGATPSACLICGASISMPDVHLDWHREQTWGKRENGAGTIEVNRTEGVGRGPIT